MEWIGAFGVPRESNPFSESPEFLHLLRGEVDPDLTRLALEIARDAYPDLDTQAYVDQIQALADRVRDRCPQGARPRHVLGQINWVLFVEEKFRGNTEEYYDYRNSYLNEVIDRKLGIPMSLSLVYLAVADRLGLVMSGVNLPAHFIVRAENGHDAIFVDPYNAGQFLDREGCEQVVAKVTGSPTVELTDANLAPCPPRVLVARMLRNLKAAYLREQEFLAALPVLRRLVALERDDPEERRDLGVCCVHAGRPGEALDHLDAYLKARPKAADAQDVDAVARVARREVAGWN